MSNRSGLFATDFATQLSGQNLGRRGTTKPKAAEIKTRWDWLEWAQSGAFKLLLTLPQRVRPTITKWDCLANDI